MWDSDGDGSLDTFDWYCSGTMVDGDTFLTAAHCTSGGAMAPGSSSRWRRMYSRSSTTAVT